MQYHAVRTRPRPMTIFLTRPRLISIFLAYKADTLLTTCNPSHIAPQKLPKLFDRIVENSASRVEAQPQVLVLQDYNFSQSLHE